MQPQHGKMMLPDYRNIYMSEELRGRVTALEAQVDLLMRSLIVGRGEGTLPSVETSSEQPVTATTLSGVGTILVNFTPKQIATVQMVAENYSTEAMAKILDCSDSTIKVHLRGFMRKAGVETRNRAALYYEDLIAGMDADRFLKLTEVEMDWAKDPAKYPKTTRMLHQKSR